MADKETATKTTDSLALAWARDVLKPIVLRAMWLGVLVWLAHKHLWPVGELVKAIRGP